MLTISTFRFHQRYHHNLKYYFLMCHELTFFGIRVRTESSPATQNTDLQASDDSMTRRQLECNSNLLPSFVLKGIVQIQSLFVGNLSLTKAIEADHSN